MYAKVRSVSTTEEINEVCTIEVGLSSGIPVIRYLGRVSSQLSMTKEKIPFIFSFLGRKLPNKKIRVNFSSDKLINSSHIDLAVTTALYLAIHDLHPDKDIWCIGEMEMDGNILPMRNIARTLFTIRMNMVDRVPIIFTPNTTEKLKSFYPEIEIVTVKNLRDIFDYFEGKVSNEDVNEKGDGSEVSEVSENRDKGLPAFVLEPILGFLGGIDQLFLYKQSVIDQIQTFDLLNTYSSKIFDNSGKIFNSLISERDQEEYESFVKDTDLTKILRFIELSEGEVERRRVHLSISNIKKFFDLGYGEGESLIKLREKVIVNIHCPSCFCDSIECRCSTSDIHKYRSLLKNIINQFDMIHISADLESEFDLRVNRKEYEIKHLSIQQEIRESRNKERENDVSLINIFQKILRKPSDAMFLANDLAQRKSKLLETI